MIIIKNTPHQPRPEDVLNATAVLFGTAVATSFTTCTKFSTKKVLPYLNQKGLQQPASNFNKIE